MSAESAGSQRGQRSDHAQRLRLGHGQCASSRLTETASRRLAATVRGVQIRVICSQASSVAAEPGARSHAGYGQVSARLGFANPAVPSCGWAPALPVPPIFRRRVTGGGVVGHL